MNRRAADFRNTSAPWTGSSNRESKKFPAGVSFDQACFVEPVNTCLKGIKQLDPQPEDVVVILGQGPIGLIFTMMAARTGARIVATDGMPERRELALRIRRGSGLRSARSKISKKPCAQMTDGRGADLVIIADFGPRNCRAGRGQLPSRSARSCCSPRPRIRSGSKFRAPTCAWENAFCAVPIARRWIYRRNRLTWYFQARLPVERLISHRFRSAASMKALNLRCILLRNR